MILKIFSFKNISSIKKTILIFLILIGIVLPIKVFSQNLAKMHVVGKGKFLPSQLIDKSVKDANGQECAGLVIVSDLDGLRFDSYNGIVKRNHKPGQDLLFLSSDERVVTVYKNGFVPLKIILSQFGIQLQKGRVWQLKITGKKRTSLIPINILTNPKGANIYIDSTKINSENEGGIKSQQVKPGKHTIKIIKSGYITITKTIHVNSNNTLFSFRLKQKQIVPIEIKSIPSGASIFINNNNIGSTNDGFFRYPGNYTIRLSKTGYLDTVAKIKVTESGNNQFLFHLTRNMGKLQLIVTPQNAQVTINDKDYTGHNTVNLIPGPYQIKVSKSGYYTKIETVNVSLNKTITKKIILSAKTGSLQFSVQPLDANVKLMKNGKLIDSWQGLKYINNLPIGNYNLVVRKTGFFDLSERIQIKHGKTSIKNLIIESSNTNIDSTQNIDFNNSNNLSTTPKLKWKFKTGGGVNASPTAADGKIFLGSGDHYLYALNQNTGKIDWKFKTNGIVNTTPAVSNGIVYFGSGDDYLYALNQSTGKLKWKYLTKSGIYSSPKISSGIIFFGSDDGFLYALNKINGHTIWKYKTGSWVISSPVISHGVVYFGSDDDYLYAVGLRNGKLKWKYKTGSWVVSSPAISNGILYFGSDDHYLYALNQKTGELKWKYKTGDGIVSSPMLSNGLVYFGSNDRYLYVLDQKSGRLKWKYKTKGVIDAAPLIKDGMIYIGSWDDRLYELDESTGKLIWKYKTGNVIESSPVYKNGMIYLGSGDNYLYAFN